MVFDKNCFMRTLPHTNIPHSVEHLHGGPKPDSGLQEKYNNVVFKVNVYCELWLSGKLLVRVVPNSLAT